MKVAVKTVSELKRELSFEVPKDRVSAKLDEVYKELGKVTTVEGHQPGNAPRSALEAHHGQKAQEELLRHLVPEIYQEGIEQEDLFPIDMPEISEVTFEDGVVTFKATFEIKPEVNIEGYKGIKVRRKSNKVTDEDIKKTLEFFKRGQGEEEVTIDDNFARGLGYATLEEFKKSLTRQLEFDKDRHNRMDLENQLIENLIGKAKLTTPESLVQRQLQRRIHEQTDQLKKKGVSEADIQEKIEETKKDLAKAVEKDIRVYLILDKIAQKENIVVKEGENLPAKVIEYLLREAEW